MQLKHLLNVYTMFQLISESMLKKAEKADGRTDGCKDIATA